MEAEQKIGYGPQYTWFGSQLLLPAPSGRFSASGGVGYPGCIDVQVKVDQGEAIVRVWTHWRSFVVEWD